MSHQRHFVRICDFRDCDGDDDDASPIVKRFFGKFLLSFLASNNVTTTATTTTLRLDPVDNQNGQAQGSSSSPAVSDGGDPQRRLILEHKHFHFSLNDYEQMTLTEKSVAFRRRATPSESNNGTFSPQSFAISFNTVEEFVTFRSKLDAALRQNAVAAAAIAPNDETKGSSSKTADELCSTKKRKYGGANANAAAANCVGKGCGVVATKMGTTATTNANDDESHSEFDSRTEEASAVQYFQFYGSLYQQQNMLQDFTRTATYQRAIFENWHDFRGKVVLDVGAGTGILSFFAAQVGAKRVYAVEASSMAAHCKELVKANGYDSVIVVLSDKIEEVELPEQVDVIVSEPMGYMLVNERMLESYMYARKFLRPGGRMFPSSADLHLALFSDDALYAEQQQRASFWAQQTFHGVALDVLQQPALDELFRQPVVDSWSGGILVSQSVSWTVDFERDPVERLHRIHMPFTMSAQRTCHVHGVASWFDVAFEGTNGRTVWLSTAPTEPLTHWYQVRCMIRRPMLVLAGQPVRGNLTMVANEKQSYDMELEMYTFNNDDDGEQYQHHQHNALDLKMPYFRYTGQPVVPPPGGQTMCPSDQLNQAVGNLLAGAVAGGVCMDQDELQHNNHQQQMMAVKRRHHHHQPPHHRACQADDQPMENGFDNAISVIPSPPSADRSSRRADDDVDQPNNNSSDDET